MIGAIARAPNPSVRHPASSVRLGFCEGGGAELDPILVTAALEMLRQQPKGERRVQGLLLRMWFGLSSEEIAKLLGIAPARVRDDWAFAKAYILAYVEEHGGSSDPLAPAAY